MINWYLTILKFSFSFTKITLFSSKNLSKLPFLWVKISKIKNWLLLSQNSQKWKFCKKYSQIQRWLFIFRKLYLIQKSTLSYVGCQCSIIEKEISFANSICLCKETFFWMSESLILRRRMVLRHFSLKNVQVINLFD